MKNFLIRNQIYILLVSIITLVCYALLYNAKTHVQAVEVVDELVDVKDSLANQVIILYREKDSAVTILTTMDSTLMAKDAMLGMQRYALMLVQKKTDSLQLVGPMIIRDTVYVTESKSFWGKVKKSVEVVSDTTLLEFPKAELEIDTIPVDTI